MSGTTNNGNGRDNAGHGGVGDGILQLSNQTSGHFLGSVPRGWMLNATGGHISVPAVPNRSQRPPRMTFTTAPAATSPPLRTPTLPLTSGHPSAQSSRVSQPATTATSQYVQADTSLDYWTGSGGSVQDANQATSSYPHQAPQTILSSEPDRSQNLPLPLPVANETTLFPDRLAPQVLQDENVQLFRHNNVNAFSAVNQQQQQQSTAQTFHHRRQSAPTSVYGISANPGANTNSGRDFANLNYPSPVSNVSSAAQAQGSSSPAFLGPSQAAFHRPPSLELNVSSTMPNHAFTFADSPQSLRSPRAVHEGHLNKLNRVVATLVATRPLNAVETARVTWLRGACEQGDLLFVLLNQLTCLQATNMQFLLTHSFSEIQIQGLTLLNMILNDCKAMSQEALNMFCNYPTPLILFAADGSVRPWMQRAKEFLQQLVVNWEIMRTKVAFLGCPPSARELAEELDADSLILSQAVYLNFFHHLFPQPSSGMMQQSYDLFRSNQQEFLKRRQREADGNVPSSARQQELRAFRLDFNQILLRHNQAPLKIFPPPYRAAQPPKQLPPPHADNQRTVATGTAHRSSGRSMSSHTPTGVTRSGSFVNTLGRPGRGPNIIPSNTAANTPQRPSQLIPPYGHVLPITVNPNPSRVALHQAHLVNPTLETEDSDSPEKPIRLYAFLEELVDKPMVIDNNTIYEKWSFEVPLEIFERRAQDHRDHKDNPFGRAIWVLRDGSVLFHLRCVRLATKEQPLDPEDISSLATSWPQNIYVSVNGTHLEFRRKALHSKDLPVDITHLVQLGVNELILSYHAAGKETTETFGIVLEVVKVLSHAAALQLPGSMDAQTSLDGIVRSLQPTTEDDDVVLSDPHISIDLIDPFTARIFDHPVRGRFCRHRECFDLVSYLQSRTCRNKDGFVHPDEWKCPLCGKDTRPPSLVVDLFLLQVKEKLIADGQSHVKAILVKEDGSWEPKENDTDASRTGQRRKSSEPSRTRSVSMTIDFPKGPETQTAVPTNVTVSEPQVIILDDDE